MNVFRRVALAAALGAALLAVASAQAAPRSYAITRLPVESW